MAKGSAGTVGLVPDWPRGCLGSPGWDRAQGGGWGAASSSLQLWHSVPAELAPPPAPGGRLLLWEGREGKVTALGLEPRAGLGCGHCSLYLLSAPSVPTPVLVCPLLGPFAVLVSPPSPSFGSVCPEKGDSPTSGGEERPQYRAREGQIPLAAVAGGQRRSPSGNPCPLPLYPTGGRAPTACTGCSRCLPPSPLSVVAALGAAAVTAKGPPGHFGFGVSQQSGGRNSLTLLRRRCWQRGAGSVGLAAAPVPPGAATASRQRAQKEALQSSQHLPGWFACPGFHAGSRVREGRAALSSFGLIREVRQEVKRAGGGWRAGGVLAPWQGYKAGFLHPPVLAPLVEELCEGTRVCESTGAQLGGVHKWGTAAGAHLLCKAFLGKSP